MLNEVHCTALGIKIQGSAVFVTNVYILVLVGCDMVLGMQCLKELGPIS